MKKAMNSYLYPLIQAGSLAVCSKKTLLVSAFFFLTGISTGIFMELTLAPAEKSSLIDYLQQYLTMDQSSVKYPNPFLFSLMDNLLLLLIIVLAGLSVFGFPAALAALACKGLALGYCTGLIAESMQGRGFMVIVTSLLPQNLILIPVFVLASSAATNYGLYGLNQKHRASKKNLKVRNVSGSYLFLMFAMAVAVGFACGLEAILSPVVLSP